MAQPLNILPQVIGEPSTDDLGPVALPAPDTSKVPTPEAAQNRADKAAMGFRFLSGMDRDTIFNEIMSGREDRVRTDASRSIDLRKAEALQDIIKDAAKAKGGPLTLDELEHVKVTARSLLTPTNSETAFEEYYSKAYLDELEQTSLAYPDNLWDEAYREEPERMRATKDAYVDALANQEIIRREKQNVDKQVGQQSYLGRAFDFSKLIVPFYYEVQMRGNTPGVGKFEGVLVGSNMDRQAIEAMRMPTAQFHPWLRAVLAGMDKGIAGGNPFLKQQFLDALLGMSTKDEFLNNLSTLVEFYKPLGAATATKFLKKGINAGRAEIALQQMLKANAEGAPTKANILGATGDVEGMATKIAAKNMIDDLQGTPNITQRLVEALPEGMRLMQGAVRANAGSRGMNMVNKVDEMIENYGGRMVAKIVDIMKVDGLPALQAAEKYMLGLKEVFKSRYPEISENIIDISKPYKDDVSGKWFVDLHIGKPGGGIWINNYDGVMMAQNYADVMGLKSAQVKASQQGLGWYLSLTRPVTRADYNIVRDALHIVDEVNPDSFGKLFSAWFKRTPEESLDLEHRINRKIATYGGSELLKIQKDIAKHIRDLSKGVVKFDPHTGEAIPAWRLLSKIKGADKDRWLEWERAVTAQKSAIDPETKVPGRWFRGEGDMEEYWLQNYKRPPSVEEVEAYFAYKIFTENDLIMRRLSVYRAKTSVGAESFRIGFREGGQQLLWSDHFDGVRRIDFPGGDDKMYIAPGVIGKGRVLDLSRPHPTKTLNDLRQGIKEGRFRLIEIYDPESRPLNGFGHIKSQRIRYVLTANAESQEINFLAQVPRRGGGHVEYDYDFYIKQAKMVADGKFNIYEGDVTLAPMNTRAKGEQIAKIFDDIRLLLKDKDLAGAKAYAKANIPHIEWKEIHGKFRQKKAEDGTIVPPQLSLNEPIRLIGRDELIVNIDKELEKRYPLSFKDGTKEGSLARQHQVEFTTQRDAYDMFTIKNEGTHYNPLFQMEPARFIDPAPTMNRAMAKIIRSNFMDEYKSYAVEHWMETAMQWLKPSKDEIRNAPYKHFNDALKNFKPDAPANIKSMLEQQHKMITQFMGEPSAVDTFIANGTEKILESIYKKFGEGKVLEWTEWGLSKMGNPIDFLRAFAFHAKIGLWSIPQVMVQMQTYAVIHGIAGTRMSVPATMAAFAQMMVRVNPDMVNSIDKLLTKVRIPGTAHWKPGEFAESVKLLERTGFGQVQGEHALLDAHHSPKVISSGLERFLDAGTFFFRETERNVRQAAWHTAYKEFRDKNPFAKIGDKEMRQMMERADFLNVNMSRASSSNLHTGIMSIPAQFYAYQLRMGELMMGKRLTGPEKARVMAWQAGLYGVPTAMGVTGLPVGDWVRQGALENGYQVGDAWYNSMFMDGIPAYVLAMVTGTHVNVGERYGVQGMEVMREAFRSDATIWKILGGAAFSTVTGTWQGADGFINAMMSGLRDDDRKFKFSLSDIKDIFQEFSGISSAFRYAAALHTGRLMSKKEAYLEPKVSGLEATAFFLSGLQPQSVSDSQLKAVSNRTFDELVKYGEKKAMTEFRRATQAMRDQDYTASENHFRRTFYYLRQSGYPEHKITTFLSRASKEHETMIDLIDWKFYQEKVRPEDVERRRPAHEAILRRRRELE